jgi:hypothetical protein
MKIHFTTLILMCSIAFAAACNRGGGPAAASTEPPPSAYTRKTRWALA